MEAKRNVRIEFLEKRRSALRGINVSDRSAQVSDQLMSLLSSRSGTWAAYRPKGDEFDPTEITRRHHQITWSYPRVLGERLEFRIPRNEMSFSEGSFGIQEPKVSESEKIEINQLEGVICPGLAFDRRGNRLGFGKGYYDKALSQFSGLKVGVCFSEQISETPIPCEGHDVPMDYIATDKELITVREEGVPC